MAQSNCTEEAYPLPPPAQLWTMLLPQRREFHGIGYFVLRSCACSGRLLSQAPQRTPMGGSDKPLTPQAPLERKGRLRPVSCTPQLLHCMAQLSLLLPPGKNLNSSLLFPPFLEKTEAFVEVTTRRCFLLFALNADDLTGGVNCNPCGTEGTETPQLSLKIYQRAGKRARARSLTEHGPLIPRAQFLHTKPSIMCLGD